MSATVESAYWSGRYVIVTGGAGFVGSWICQRLLEWGADVTCIDNFSTGVRENIHHLSHEPSFHVVEQDVCTRLRISGHIDHILHLASPASPLHYLRLPLETLMAGSLGTMHALELAMEKSARFLLASTSEVYGDPEVHPQPECYWGHVNPIGPRSVYDESKRYAEALTMAYRRARGVNTAIVRIFNTYGPRMRADDGRAIPAFMSQALAGVPLTVAGDGSQTRSLCYVEDTVAGILAMAATDHAGPVNVGGSQEVTIFELANHVRKLASSGSSIEFVDLPVDDPRQRRPDTTLATRLLDWQQKYTLDAGLKQTLDWFAQRSAEP